MGGTEPEEEPEEPDALDFGEPGILRKLSGKRLLENGRDARKG